MAERTLMHCPFCGKDFHLERSFVYLQKGSLECPNCGGAAKEVSKVIEEPPPEPKWVVPDDCERCGASLEYGHVTRYRKVEGEYAPVEYFCHKCDTAERVADFSKTGSLSPRLIMWATLQDIREGPTPEHIYHIPRGPFAKILRGYKAIEKGIGLFEKAVWCTGLQEYIQKAKCRGHSVEHNGLTARMYTMAGRVLITLEGEEGESVTVIAAENEHGSGRMGMQGVDATQKQAVSLLNKAVNAYKEGNLQFQPDTEVGIL